jgi:hypothetical protein
MFDLGMFPPFGPFGRNSPTHCLGETPFETVSYLSGSGEKDFFSI